MDRKKIKQKNIPILVLLVLISGSIHAQFKLKPFQEFGFAPLDLSFSNSLSTDLDADQKAKNSFFKSDYLNPGKRFLYSSFVMVSSHTTAHLYIMFTEYELTEWNRVFRFENIEKTYTMPPRWDRDHWSYNYGVHPVMGSLTFLAYRNRGGNFTGSFLCSALHAFLYEYIVASSTQRPSINDMIVTPIGGSILGESIYQIKKLFLRDRYLSFFEKTAITIMDPYEIIRYGFNYSRLIK